MSEEKEGNRQFPVRDQHGREVLTVKQIGDRTKIFIGDEEIMVCRVIPLDISVETAAQIKEMESINDVIDTWEEELEQEGIDHARRRAITPELEFFVNCSNLQVWAEHDCDTCLLDYRLSFPLLKEMAEHGNKVAKMRFREELIKRYKAGSKNVRKYLEEEFWTFLQVKPEISGIPEEEREGLLELLQLMPPEERKSMEPLAGAEIRDGRVLRLTLWGSIWEHAKDGQVIHRKIFPEIPEALLSFTRMEELIIMSGALKELPSWLSQLEHLRKISVNGTPLMHVFKGIERFPSLKEL